MANNFMGKLFRYGTLYRQSAFSFPGGNIAVAFDVGITLATSFQIDFGNACIHCSVPRCTQRYDYIVFTADRREVKRNGLLSSRLVRCGRCKTWTPRRCWRGCGYAKGQQCGSGNLAQGNIGGAVFGQVNFGCSVESSRDTRAFAIRCDHGCKRLGVSAVTGI